MIRLLIVLLFLCFPVQSFATLAECQQACVKAYPTPSAGTQVSPWPITFERSADQNGGKAAVLFRTLQDSFVVSVSVNGEVARHGKPYRGSPVWLLSKSGDRYPRPLHFIYKTADGKIYTATSGSATTPTTSTNPTIGYSKVSGWYTTYGTRNGGRQAWRIPKKGPEFGKSCMVEFSDGHKVMVKDTSHNYRESDGFVFKPGLGPNGTGDANTGTAHGGIYVHAPYKTNPQQVRFHYN